MISYTTISWEKWKHKYWHLDFTRTSQKKAKKATLEPHGCHQLLLTCSCKCSAPGSIWLWIYWKIIMLMNESPSWDYAVRTGFFTCKGFDHHTLTQSYLDMFRSWQKNKDYNTELHMKKKHTHTHTNPIQNCHAGIRGKNKFTLCQMIQSRHKKNCHASCLLSRSCSAVSLYTLAKQRKVEDKEADLICCALLPGISCFDRKNKPSSLYFQHLKKMLLECYLTGQVHQLDD